MYRSLNKLIRNNNERFITGDHFSSVVNKIKRVN